MKCPKCGTEFYGDKCPNCGYEPTEYEIAIDTLMQLTGVGKKRAEELYKAGFKDVQSIAESDEDKLSNVHTIGKELAKKIKKEAEKFVTHETKEFVTICPVCGAIVPPGADRCPRCGTPVSEFKNIAKKSEEQEKIQEEEDSILNKAICPFCGALIPKDSKVCPVCGANLENITLEEPKPMEDPYDVLKKFFGVSEIPQLESSNEAEENADIRVCPNCGAIVVNRDTCPFCGTPLPKIEPKNESEEDIEISETLNVCPNCGAFIPPDATVCPVCGAKIESAEKEQAVSLAELLHSKVEPEREEERQVSPELTAEKEQAVSVAELLSAKKESLPPSAEEGAKAPEQGEVVESKAAELQESELSIEDMQELETAIAIGEKTEPQAETHNSEAMDKESVEEIMEALEREQSMSVDDLKELENVLIAEKAKPISVKKPKIEREKKEKQTEKLESKHEKKQVSYDSLNKFLYSFGSNEDILAFSPLLVLLIYISSLSFISEPELSIVVRTISIFILSLGAIAGFVSYLKLRNFNKQELKYGALLALAPLLTLVPYASYLSLLVLVGIVYLGYKSNLNYWLLYLTAAIGFGIQLNFALFYTMLFIGIFSVHIIYRYREMDFGLATAPKLPAKSLREEGMTAFKEHRYYDAIYLLRRALKEHPNDVEIMNTLGLAYGRIGNTELAIEHFTRITELKPDYKYAWNNMGNVYARMEKYDKAISCYKKALVIDPNYSDALLNMGYVMIRQGSYGEAMKMAERIKAVT